MQIADAAGAYTGLNALMAAKLADARTATQQRNETGNDNADRPAQAAAVERADSQARFIQDRVEVQSSEGESALADQMKRRSEALREAQMNRKLEEMQLRAQYRDQVMTDLGLTDDVLSQASMAERFVYERQIEDRLDREVRQKLVDRMVDETLAGQSPVNTPNNLSAAVSTGMLSESDLTRLSIRV